jgi:hypothetical protein
MTTVDGEAVEAGYSWDCPNCGERITSIYLPPALTKQPIPDERLRKALERVLPDALSALTEGSDFQEAPEPSDEPGSPYVVALADEIARRLSGEPNEQ